MRKAWNAHGRSLAWLLAAALAAPCLLAGCAEQEPVTPSTPPVKGPAKTEAPAPEKAPETPAEKAPETPAEKAPEKPAAEPAKPAAKAAQEEGWEPIFDGKTLDHWNITDFAGHGKVHVDDGKIILEMGEIDLTGITWADKPEDLPKLDYEVELKAMRLEGNDFFCALTFPYKDSACSLVVGGWGGSLVGISSFNYMDASENETTKVMQFEDNRWYPIRVRVRDDSIQAWINHEMVVDAKPGDRKVDVRMEVEESKPLGVASYRTKAALKDIRIRRLLD